MRSSYGATPFTAASGAQVAPKNVIVQFVELRGRRRQTRAPRRQTVGQGDAWVFTDGKVVDGHVDAAGDKTQPAQFVDDGRRRRSS